MEQIAAWLAGPRDFDAGRRLYDQYGDSQILKYLFAAGESEYAREKLASALQELLPVTPAPLPVAPDAQAGQELAKLQAQLKNLYQIRSHCHSGLETADGRPARAALAQRILETGQQIEALLHQRQYLKQFGQLPPQPAGAGRDLSSPAALILEINRLRVRISKHRHKPQKAAQVAAWQNLVREYQQKIKTPAAPAQVE